MFFKKSNKITPKLTKTKIVNMNYLTYLYKRC